MFKDHTISEEIELEGPTFFPSLKDLKEQVSLIIKPKQEKGVILTVEESHEYINYDLQHLYGAASFLNIWRNNFLCSTADIAGNNILPKGGVKISILEHLMSGLALADITAAEIVVPQNRFKRMFRKDSTEGVVPILGAGVTDLYNRLVDSRLELDSYQEVLAVIGIRDFTSSCGSRKIKVSPSTKLEVIVNGADLGSDLIFPPIEINDLYNSKESYLSARPLARLQKKTIYWSWRGMLNLGFQGITNSNYIIANPGITAETMQKQFGSQFKSIGSEPFYHTAVCDLPGELFAINNTRVHGKFELTNTNHPFRVWALKQMHNYNLFKPKE